MLPPKLTTKQYRIIQEMWLNDFHSKLGADYENGNAERWWSVFVAFLAKEGFELFSPELRTQEDYILSSGRSQEYLAALADVCAEGFQPNASEYDQTVLVLTASPDERAEALKKVLGGSRG